MLLFICNSGPVYAVHVKDNVCRIATKKKTLLATYVEVDFSTFIRGKTNCLLFSRVSTKKLYA